MLAADPQERHEYLEGVSKIVSKSRKIKKNLGPWGARQIFFYVEPPLKSCTDLPCCMRGRHITCYTNGLLSCALEQINSVQQLTIVL